MPQILLYDASTGELAPVDHGDAIRVEIHTADLASQGLVDVASTRPFVLFSLLQRLLHSEGLPTKFFFGSRSAEQLVRELELQAELADEEQGEGGEDGQNGEQGRGGEGGQEGEGGEHGQEGEQGRGGERGHGGEGGQEGEGGEHGQGRQDGEDESTVLYEEELDEEALDELALAQEASYGDEEESAETWEGRCLDIRFGAAREGEEWAGGESAGRMTLAEAMRRFGHQALVFYLTGTHYSQPLGDPVSGMTSACKHLQRLRETLAKLQPGRPSPPDMAHHVEAFREALATDLDTPSALVALFEWVLEAERRGYELGDEDLRSMLELLELSDLGSPQGGSAALGAG